MKLPSRIAIGPFAYRVRRADIEDFGECDSNDFVISLRRRMGVEATREVLFHELLHACVAAAGFEWPEDEEEALVKRLSPVLLDSLQRNDALRGYLFEG